MLLERKTTEMTAQPNLVIIYSKKPTTQIKKHNVDTKNSVMLCVALPKKPNSLIAYIPIPHKSYALKRIEPPKTY